MDGEEDDLLAEQLANPPQALEARTLKMMNKLSTSLLMTGSAEKRAGKNANF